VPRRRLDVELVRRGLVGSRAEAHEALNAGLVTVGGVPANRGATLVDADQALALARPPRPFVSRGGSKLAAALERFGVDPAGRSCLDAGASTGGFTDCLLRGGARRVAAVDVGYGQLAWELRNDQRVVVLERTNVRDLTPGAVSFSPDLVVADLSFISLRLVLPALVGVAAPVADMVVLVKPQFEAGPADVGRGGVVRDPGVWRRTIEGVMTEAAHLRLEPAALMASPLPGPAGNVEFPLHLVRRRQPGRSTLGSGEIDAAIGEGEALRR
jgi:23S rRNA (cytidine1920-2'-O)/16S rRNA (cytidine1409-2'-O)-methyltransferase